MLVWRLPLVGVAVGVRGAQIVCGHVSDSIKNQEMLTGLHGKMPAENIS